MAIERAIVRGLQQALESGGESDQARLMRELYKNFLTLQHAGLIDISDASKPDIDISSIGVDVTLQHKINVVNPDARIIDVDGRLKRLTQKEYQLFSYLFENRGRLFSVEELKQQLWPPNRSSAVVEKAIGRLRDTIEPVRETPTIIINVHGAGYKLG